MIASARVMTCKQPWRMTAREEGRRWMPRANEGKNTTITIIMMAACAIRFLSNDCVSDVVTTGCGELELDGLEEAGEVDEAAEEDDEEAEEVVRKGFSEFPPVAACRLTAASPETSCCLIVAETLSELINEPYLTAHTQEVEELVTSSFPPDQVMQLSHRIFAVMVSLLMPLPFKSETWAFELYRGSTCGPPSLGDTVTLLPFPFA